MPETNLNRNRYTAEERKRCDAAFEQLRKMIWPDELDAAEFRRALDGALASGFLINWPNKDGNTLLHSAVMSVVSVRTGLPQILVLVEEGAGVNVLNSFGRTPLGLACSLYVESDKPKYLSVIDALLEAGARPELNESWKNGWGSSYIKRRDWLDAYIKTWPERRARSRADDAAPGFDYAL